MSFTNSVELTARDFNKDLLYLENISKGFKAAVRSGNESDSPEGSRYITVSDTLANIICKEIDSIVNSLRTHFNIEKQEESSG